MELDFCAVTGLKVDSDTIRLGHFLLQGGHMWLFFNIVLRRDGGGSENRTAVRRRWGRVYG